MKNNHGQAIPVDLEQWAPDLACPVCYAVLQFSLSAVVCTGCGRDYPIVDGIPVLIPLRGAKDNK